MFRQLPYFQKIAKTLEENKTKHLYLIFFENSVKFSSQMLAIIRYLLSSLSKVSEYANHRHK